MESSPLIRCGKLKITMFMPFIAPIFCYLNSMSISYMEEHWKKHASLFLLFLSLGEFISGAILSLISFFLKSENKQKHIDNNQTKQWTKISIITAEHDHEKLKTYFLLIIPSFFFILSMYFFYFMFTHFHTQITKLNVIIVQIGFASLLCSKFLKYTYHKHHAWSSIMIMIGFVIVLPTSIDKYCGDDSLLFLLFYFICYLFFTCAEVFDKWLMDYRFIKPSLVLFIEGSIGLIIASVMIIILSFVTCSDTIIKYGFCDGYYKEGPIESFIIIKELFQQPLNYWMFISFMVCSSGFNIMVKYTIFHYTPIHRSASDLISCILCTFTWENPTSNYILNYTAFVFGYLIIFIGTLIYNEYIIIYFYGLNEATKIAIQARNEEESNKINNDLITIDSI